MNDRIIHRKVFLHVSAIGYDHAVVAKDESLEVIPELWVGP